MRAEEIRELTDDEIQSPRRGARGGAFPARHSASATETLEDPLRLRAIRKDVARLKTILRQRQLAATPSRAAR